MSQFLKKYAKNTLLLTLGNVIFILSLYYGGALQRVDNWAYDWRMAEVRSEQMLSDEIAVVMIDDASLQALQQDLGRWPWPRSAYAELLNFFAMGNPRAVLFDIMLTEKQAADAADDDRYLGNITAELDFAYHASRFVADTADQQNPHLLNPPLPQGFADYFSVNGRYQLPIPLPGFRPAQNNKFYLPYDGLWQASPGLGVVEISSEDIDGAYRRAPLLVAYQKNHYASLSATALLDRLQPTQIRKHDHAIHIDEMRIPVDKDEKLLVNYYGQYQPYSISGLFSSIQKIQQGDFENLLVDPYEFEDKYVFIGASAAGLNDLKHTPVDGRLPGVYIHASVLGNLLQNDFLEPPDRTHTVALTVVLVFLTVTGIFLFKHGVLHTLVPASLLLVFIVFAYYQFSQNLVIEMAAPGSAILSAWLTTFGLLSLTEGKEKRRFKRMMSQYLSPAVLETVVANHDDFAHAGVGSSEEITVLFSDIRGFTNMSENLPAAQVVEILNYYFSEMTDAIFKQQGTIDKFIGDAIMAFWGAPVRDTKHATQAVRAALEMNRRLTDVNRWLDSKNYPRLAIGVGLHTGQAILGNIGSDNKLDYTIIGDTVNLSSRMEGLTKQYQTSILLTENTYEQLDDSIHCRIVDLVRVKGKQQPVKIYQPLASEMNDEQARRLVQDSQAAFDAYLRQDWSTALQILSDRDDDPVACLLKERCRNYQQNPPAADWDGVFTMTSK